MHGEVDRGLAGPLRVQDDGILATLVGREVLIVIGVLFTDPRHATLDHHRFVDDDFIDGRNVSSVVDPSAASNVREDLAALVVQARVRREHPVLEGPATVFVGDADRHAVRQDLHPEHGGGSGQVDEIDVASKQDGQRFLHLESPHRIDRTGRQESEVEVAVRAFLPLDRRTEAIHDADFGELPDDPRGDGGVVDHRCAPGFRQTTAAQGRSAQAVKPPSIVKLAPVTNPDSGPAR